MKCAEPDCAGTVVGGYCEICGTAPEPVVPQVVSIATAPFGTDTQASRTTAAAPSKPAGSRGRLGAGIVAIPSVPRGQPASSILTDPQVPERHRYCGNPCCGRPVGRGSDGTPGRTEGFCTQCGTRYSFIPKLSRGTLVGGQYDVQGCIAHGGLGWIYLAIDRNVHNRWVVLKGLVNSSDADAMAAAAAEAQVLAEVEHPNIVRIYNFVQHADDTGTPVGYIVMEYVGGTSLKQIRRGRGGPLPADQAVAYIIEIAPAIGHLHAQGLAYCDFKPDNVMQTDEQLKLIDLGAVVAMDDPHSTIYGTLGYQAPEIARTGPTVASDVYTVGRTLAVLVIDVPQHQGRFVEQLPGPESVPVFARYESLYRAIIRATDPDPGRRFATMGELTDQLTGVLHQIVAAETGKPQPRMSSHFSPKRAVYGAGPDALPTPASVIAALSVPKVDPTDPGAAVLATTSGTPPAQLENALSLARGGAPQHRGSSLEVALRLVRAALEIGAADDARNRLADLKPRLDGDWRHSWYSGQIALLDGDFTGAAERFRSVFEMLPGELDPQLALAATSELRSDPAAATRYYETVWRTNHTFYSAAFGLARQRARAGDRTGAVAALDQISTSSAHSTAAGATGVQLLLEHRETGTIDEQTLVDAGERVSRLGLESAARRAAIRLRVFGVALDWLRAGNTARAPRLLGADFTESGVRLGMENCYRVMARDTSDLWERITLVEKANAIRPRSRL